MAKKQKIALMVVLSTLFLLLAVFLVVFFNWKNNYQDKLPPKTKIGEINLAGKDRAETEKILSLANEKIKTQGISFKYGEKIVVMPLEISALSADIPESGLEYADSIMYEHTDTLSALFNNNGNPFLSYLITLLSKKFANHQAIFSYTPTSIEKWLIESFPELIVKPEPAYFSLTTSGELVNNKEKIGKEINLDEILADLNNSLSNLENQTIIIKTRSKYPEVKQSDLEPLKEAAQKIISNGDENVYFTELINNKEEQLDWKIKNQEIITWISTNKEDGQRKISFDREKIKEYLTKNIAVDINQPATLPRFEMKNGKVSSWQTGVSGRELDLEASSLVIANALLNSEKEAKLIVNEINADSLSSEASFKIEEIIGTGHSNFSGSPANRRHNIAVGAAAVHGRLIKPGEEFSLIQNLGEIDAASGYLPELVIKGEKTIPEYGGGLCQIATTLFRSALGSGLPITARRNHSYRVAYYEPAGTDAAVYDPWPDVKFINDTGNYILIQSKITGNDIYFDFWGVKDGRLASTTVPVVYNIVKPAPSKLIETTTLKPGEKKCTERAHNGADAYFDYTVIYPEGSTTTPEQIVRFKSHYVPWQEVCLIGKSSTSTPLISTTTPLTNSTSTVLETKASSTPN
ncbi:MAG: VanW family protein [Patescibacteria group bacterium]